MCDSTTNTVDENISNLECIETLSSHTSTPPLLQNYTNPNSGEEYSNDSVNSGFQCSPNMINSYEIFKKEKIMKLIEIKDIIENINYMENKYHNIDDESLQTILNEIHIYTIKNCPHEWIDDMIDIDYETSMNITFCEICSLTK